MSRLCLVVDDEKAIRLLLKVLLESKGFSVVEAADASVGLQLVKDLGGSICLVITDIYMPGELNGVDLAREVRKSTPEVPVILMSGFSNLDCDAYRHGEFPLMEKPFHPAALIAEIERLIKPQGCTASASSS